jgi:hypothetical protein
MADWTRRFDEPIPLPNGRLLRTLLEAGRYVAKLPKARHDRPEWRKATSLLLMAAEGRIPALLANAALMRAVETGNGTSETTRSARKIK